MRSCRERRVAAALLVSVIAGIQAARADEPPRPRIVVVSDAVVASDPVRLRDVATVDGDDGLGDLVVGRAPNAGELRLLDGGTILSAVQAAVGDLDHVRYTIPPVVRVRRATQEVGEATIRELVESFVADAMAAGAVDVVVRSVDVPGPVRIPVGSYTARVVPQPGAPFVGRVRLQVDFSVDDHPVRTVWVTADIGFYGPVVTVRRPVARGEVVGEGDLSVDRRDLSQVPRGVLGDPADVVGRVARTSLVPWAPIRREQVTAAAAVHRGDVVLLVAQRAGLRITAPGEVRQDGAAGESVRVVNRASQKALVGRVVDASTVAVEF